MKQGGNLGFIVCRKAHTCLILTWFAQLPCCVEEEIEVPGEFSNSIRKSSSGELKRQLSPKSSFQGCLKENTYQPICGKLGFSYLLCQGGW